MTLDKPQMPGTEPDFAPRPAVNNVYEFPSGRKLDSDAPAPAGGEDTVLQELEEALHNWF